MTAHATTTKVAATDQQESTLTVTARFHLWTVDEYLKIINAGIITTDDKTELLDGYITARMPSNKPHDAAISFVQDYFTEKYFKKYTLRSERAIKLSETSMPEPDYVVAVYRDDKYKNQWPSPPDILLLIEVSDATLSTDRNFKQGLYAKAGIQEYWIINIPNQQIEVHTKPDTEAGTYGAIEHHKQQNTFTSPFVGKVVVADLLPKPE